MLREKKALSDLKQHKLYVPKLMHCLHFRFDWHHSHCEPMFYTIFLIAGMLSVEICRNGALYEKIMLIDSCLLLNSLISNVILPHFEEERKKISSFSVVIREKGRTWKL